MVKLKGFACLLLLFCLFVVNLSSQEKGSKAADSQVEIYTEAQRKLKITSDDVKLVAEEDPAVGGYHLYIRKLPNVQSVLLTETTKDPNGKNDNYTYRAKEYNRINGDEVRLLDGQPLFTDSAKYSLVDSTIEYTDFFGPTFHIYLPETMIYGYPWSRNGEVKVEKGTFINIRSFEKPFADYTGNFMDNPFMFDSVMKKMEPKPAVFHIPEEPDPEEPEPEEEPAVPEVPEEPEIEEVPVIEPVVVASYENIMTDDYNPIASDKLKEISNEVTYSRGPETLVDDIIGILERGNHKENLDVVFAIDATGSMKNDVEKLKKDLLPALEKYFGKDSNARVGLLFYRDYGDAFNYKNLPVKFFNFTTDFKAFSKNLNSVRITGLEGGDIPEAVYEAIYSSTMFYDWRPDSDKQIIIIGDAEPHPTPRGTKKYSKDYVMALADFMGVTINSILLPKN